jgi:TatD DNase family protein
MERERLEKISLVDGHAHLDELPDLSQSIREAKEAGVIGVIGVGVDRESNQKILEIAKTNQGYIYPAIGYHPWQMKEKEVEANLSFIRDHVEKCLALGEIGLDYKIKAKKELQWRVFGELLDVAYEFNKPIIIHCRHSHRHAFEMVKEKEIRKAIFHWYSGPLDLLDEILNMGYFISATPASIYSPPHQEAIKRTPLGRILLETDAPVSYQGRESRLKDVWISMEAVARLKGLDFLSVSGQTTINASRFFQVSFHRF